MTRWHDTYAVPYTYFLISDLSLISIISYISPWILILSSLDPLLGMSVIRVVLHNNLILFGSPASTAFRSASRPTAVALTHVYRHIFTGPTSAMNPAAKANKSKAKKFKLTEVTGRTITYASVQVRYLRFSNHFLIDCQAYVALSSMSQWGSSDNLFNLQLFYDAIVEMFERDPQDPWVVDTLEWWKE